MNARMSFSWCVVPFAAVVAFLLVTRTSFLGFLGLDREALRQLVSSQLREVQHGQELDRQGRIVRDRIEAKRQVLEQLLAGNVSFREAVDRFHEVNLSSKECPDRFDLYFEGNTAKEKICRQVMAWAETSLEENPSLDAGTIRTRIETEMKQEILRIQEETSTASVNAPKAKTQVEPEADLPS